MLKKCVGVVVYVCELVDITCTQWKMKLVALLQFFAIVSALEAARVSPRQAPTIVYQQFHVDSQIVARYATTRISSVVRNDADVSQELSFRVQLPETAFISNFTMWVVAQP